MLIEAKEQLDRFYAEYNEKKAKSVKKSKELESQTIAALANTNTNVWVIVM
jgi:Clathrin light chain